jgi:hypothetical protein
MTIVSGQRTQLSADEAVVSLAKQEMQPIVRLYPDHVTYAPGYSDLRLIGTIA